MRAIMTIPLIIALNAFAAVAAAGANLDFKNPLIRQRADPWVLRHADGNYYFTAGKARTLRMPGDHNRHRRAYRCVEPKTP
jgi:GH43 family beta-xylosidase